jgi:glycine/D-amino acid oxidase-like deaminating enzyme
LLRKLKELDVEIKTEETVKRVRDLRPGIAVETEKATYVATYVFNSTYSSINQVNKNSNLPVIPFKHELTEMCLVELPPELQGKAYTVMCGPFFSIMPFPDKGVYTLSHVRYTPHSEWIDTEENIRDPHTYLQEIEKTSHFPQMYADVKRFMKAGQGIRYTGESLWEIKTVLPQSEGDDSRPILFKRDHGGVQNYICIMGGKIDNIYDVFRELNYIYENASA